MSDFTAIKKELSRVRQQKRDAHAALAQIAHDNGFFNPGWGKGDEWLDASEDVFGSLDENGYPSYYSIQVEDTLEQRRRSEAVVWAQWWIKFKEWDLLGQPGTPYPSQLQGMYEKFLALDSEIQEFAKKIGDASFARKHPGLTAEQRLPRFPDALILACWANES